MNPSILAVSYHYIRSKDGLLHPGIHPLTPEDFESQLRVIEAKASLTGPDAFDAWLDSQATPQRSVLLTFDDGLVDHWAAAKLLEEHDTRGAFFVCSRPYLEQKALPVHKVHWLRSSMNEEEFVAKFTAQLPSSWSRQIHLPPEELRAAAAETYQFDTLEVGVLKYLINFSLPYECVDHATSEMLKDIGLDDAEFCRFTYLTLDQLSDMAANGHRLGCHGHLHKPFSRFGEAELIADLAKNQSFLTPLIGRKPTWLAYPYGSEWSLPSDAATFVETVGLEFAFTYERGWIRPGDLRHRLKRVDCNELHSFLDAPPEL